MAQQDRTAQEAAAASGSRPLPAGFAERARPAVVDVSVGPKGSLEVLSQSEVASLSLDVAGVADLFRRCALAVLNSGQPHDDAAEVLRAHSDFEIAVYQRTRGLKLRIKNAPATAFVDGQMIEGVKEHLFAVLRDLVYTSSEIQSRFSPDDSAQITDAVFHVLRNAGVLKPGRRSNLVVCWGGHAITSEEYEYTKEVGYHLGLRGLDICTGCGDGAMKGPMKGAAVGHAKQRIRDGVYLGLTEPGIIAAESPNPMVNELVIMPDIEKRLEAFVRMGHAIVVFPGGAGTAEEILFLLGLLLHPDNADRRLPLFFTGPQSAEPYFEMIDWMVRETLGEPATHLYETIIDNPSRLARRVQSTTRDVRRGRRRSGDAFYFNWLLHIPDSLQRPFPVSHDSMQSLILSSDLPVWELAANLRRAFSGIVTGNVKAHGIAMIEERGPFSIQGDNHINEVLDRVLRAFIDQKRMKINADAYVPCFTIG